MAGTGIRPSDDGLKSLSEVLSGTLEKGAACEAVRTGKALALAVIFEKV